MKTKDKFCKFCKGNGEKVIATHIGLQSIDCGKTITRVAICKGHAWGWTDGTDWACPRPKPIKMGVSNEN